MCDNSKPTHDVLTKLIEIHLDSFDRRRAYEWKLSLAIWTALAAFIALVLKNEKPVQLPPGTESLFDRVAIGIVGLQTLFQVRVKLSNDADKHRARGYEEDISGKRMKSRVDLWSGWWSLVVHVSITILLIAGAGSVVYKDLTKLQSFILLGFVWVLGIAFIQRLLDAFWRSS